MAHNHRRHKPLCIKNFRSSYFRKIKAKTLRIKTSHEKDDLEIDDYCFHGIQTMGDLVSKETCVQSRWESKTLK